MLVFDVYLGPRERGHRERGVTPLTILFGIGVHITKVATHNGEPVGKYNMWMSALTVDNIFFRADIEHVKKNSQNVSAL